MRLVTDDATFRANPEYEVVLLDRLAPAEQSTLRAFDDSRDLYGALMPRRGSTAALQAVSSETALLVYTLATAGPLPRYVVERLGEDAERTLRRLVIDRVLEVLVEGRFVCGPQVTELFLGEPSSSDIGEDRNLAVAALQYGQELTGLPQHDLGLRLYFYGRQPVSPELSRRLGDTGAVAKHLGIASRGPIRRALERGWVPVRLPTRGSEHWWEWSAPSDARQLTASDSLSYKLYVSPAVNDLRTTLEILPDALSAAQGVTGFKVGAGITGICRPDKLIVYFTHFDDLRAFAQELESRLAGCAAHGVPFTAAVTSDALLSWGADPPRPSDPSHPTSWRMWVTERLAEHLVAARGARFTSLEPWQFALERLRLGGIDTGTWIPTSGMWPEALAAG
jgi:hypothetical protein